MRVAGRRVLVVAGVALSVVVTGAAGCVSALQERRAGTTMQALTTGKGIVVLSTSAAETCRANTTVVKLVRDGESGSDAVINVNNGYERSDFEDRFGTFDAYVLPPGIYRVRAAVLGSLSYRNPEIGWFELRAGEIKYVGDVHAAGCNGLLGGGEGTKVWAGDQWESVQPKLARRFPGLAPARVGVQLFSPEAGVGRLAEAAPPPAAAPAPAASAPPEGSPPPPPAAPTVVVETAVRSPELLPGEEPPRMPSWSFGGLMGISRGGDTVVTAFLTDGSLETLQAGTGVTFAGYIARGLFGTARQTLLIGLEAGVKGWNIGGNNADFSISLFRFPVTPQLRYQFGISPGPRLLLAAGPQIETGLHVSGSGAAAPTDVRFDTALGAMGEVGVVLEGTRGQLGVSVRYTRIRYHGADDPGSVDASNLGVFFSLAWTRFRPLR